MPLVGLSVGTMYSKIYLRPKCSSFQRLKHYRSHLQFCHVAGAQVQVHLPAGVRLQRLRLLVHEEWEEEDVEQGRGEGHHAGPGEGPQHLLSQQRRDNSKLWIGWIFKFVHNTRLCE